MSVAGLDRPARRQVTKPASGPRAIEADRGAYNIWYNKYSNDPRYHALEKAKTRINVAKDSGTTRASTLSSATFCLHFARGCCMRGHECTYLHRIPLEGDEYRLGISMATDVFGREKHREDRDDMGGVGTFSRENKTLYVGNISPSSNNDAIILKHFSEFGDIEKINVLYHRGVAFVTYRFRLNAEFAREAMLGQSLNGNEVLNVRWATEDPNPRVKDELKRKAQLYVGDKILENLPVVGERGSVADYDPDEYFAAGAKKAKTNEEAPAMAHQTAATIQALPMHYGHNYHASATGAQGDGQASSHTPTVTQTPPMQQAPPVMSEAQTQQQRPAKRSLISDDTLAAIAKFNEKTRRHQTEAKKLPPVPPKPSGALVAYDTSDDETDEPDKK